MKNKHVTENQVLTVLTHLINHDGITTFDAINKYGITRLSAKIHILRHRYGYNIVNEDFVGEGGYTFARYKLKKYVD